MISAWHKLFSRKLKTQRRITPDAHCLLTYTFTKPPSVCTQTVATTLAEKEGTWGKYNGGCIYYRWKRNIMVKTQCSNAPSSPVIPSKLNYNLWIRSNKTSFKHSKARVKISKDSNFFRSTEVCQYYYNTIIRDR